MNHREEAVKLIAEGIAHIIAAAQSPSSLDTYKQELDNLRASNKHLADRLREAHTALDEVRTERDNLAEAVKENVQRTQHLTTVIAERHALRDELDRATEYQDFLKAVRARVEKEAGK